MKCTWKIINKEKRTTKQDIGIQALMLDKLIRNQKEMAETYNSYFLSIVKTIRLNNNTYTSASAVNPINMLISYVYIST
jgi:hypothetical protein